MDTKEVGARIRRAREAARITQRELANQVGLSQVQISRLERGEHSVSLRLLRQIAGLVHVSEGYLLGHTSESEGTAAMSDPRQSILDDYQAPAGLRDLAADEPVLAWLKPTADEWHILALLAQGWPDAGLVQRDGWVQILLALRTVTPQRGDERGGGVRVHEVIYCR